MSYAVIRLLEDTLIAVKADSYWRQPDNQAVNVAPYHYVTPYIRLNQDPLNSLATSGNGSITFRFLTAPILDEPQETGITNATTRVSSPNLPTKPWRESFLDSASGAPISIPNTDPTIDATTQGKIYSMPFMSSGDNIGRKPIINPAGLISLMIENNHTNRDMVLRLEIYLVCRGPG